MTIPAAPHQTGTALPTFAAAPRPQEEGDQQVSTHKYQKKPVVIEAMRIPIKAVDGEEAFTAGHASIADWLMRHGFTSFKATDDGGYDIETLEGTMHANPGDWIIRGVQGEFYPCKPDIFDATYLPVHEQTAALERLGSWGMQRPDVDADGYPIDDWDDDTTSSTEPLGWWVISGVELLAALRRCAAGESPDLVYAEIYANSEHEQLRPSCDWCPEPATWVRRGAHGCADHPINKHGWERL